MARESKFIVVEEKTICDICGYIGDTEYKRATFSEFNLARGLNYPLEYMDICHHCAKNILSLRG